jgi:hypothetical protein
MYSRKLYRTLCSVGEGRKTAFYVACGFTNHPATRTLGYFDQIMCEYGLWSLVNDLLYKRNVEDEVIDESEEHILNIDNTHLRGYSTGRR